MRGSGVDYACCAGLDCERSAFLVYVISRDEADLLQRCGNFLLLADIGRVERGVVVPLYNVQHGDCVSSSQQLLDDVSPHKAGASNDEIVIASGCH